MSLSVLIGSQALNAKIQAVNNDLQYWMLQMSLTHSVTHGPLRHTDVFRLFTAQGRLRQQTFRH